MKVFIAFVAIAAFVCVNALPSEPTAKVEEKPVEASPPKVTEEIAKKDDEMTTKIELFKRLSKELVKGCVEETGVDAETAVKIAAGDFSFKDEKAQCYIKCFFKRAGMMNDAGEPQLNAFIEKHYLQSGEAKNEKMEEHITKCIKEVGANECETAHKIFECYWTHRAAAKTA